MRNSTMYQCSVRCNCHVETVAGVVEPFKRQAYRMVCQSDSMLKTCCECRPGSAYIQAYMVYHISLCSASSVAIVGVGRPPTREPTTRWYFGAVVVPQNHC